MGGERRARVSIVIPCFDAERWLGAAIDSALAQTWPEVEVIVVDDGSRDGSLALARSYGDRVRVWTGPNAGASAARNRGLALATGDHVQFLDADDLLLPTKVERCLQASAGPDTIPFSRKVVFGGATQRDGALARLLRGKPASFDPDDPVVTALTYEIQTGQSLYPTERLRAIGGFREGMRWLEDIDLNLRLVLSGARFVPVDEPLMLLRDHASPGRLRLSPGAAAGRIAGESMMIDSVRQAGRWSPRVAAAFADRLAYAGRQAWRAGHPELGREAFALARSLARHPAPTGFPVYNAVANWVGLERLESWLDRRPRRSP